MATPIPRNRCALTLAEAARATGGTLHGPAAMTVRGISIDSRTIEPGELFVALVAQRDGHEFIGDAAERGATAAIVQRGRRVAQTASIEVDDTLSALGALARFHLRRERASRPLPTIAIGGAAGKTTTKELTAAVAAALFGPTLATPGNLNNLIGAPMTVLALDGGHRAAVIECGTSRRGEIPKLAAIVSPDVALVVNVDIEHSEGLGTLEEIAEEETALFRTAATAVAPADDPLVTARVPAGLRTLTFGESPGADVRLARRSVRPDGGSRVTLELSPGLVSPGVEPRLESELQMLGGVAALNAAAAVAAVAAARSSPHGPGELSAMGKALGTVQPVPGRLSTLKAGGVLVIDDTYNANPRSVRAALEAARDTATALGARLLVALGDMLELGPLAHALHAEIVSEVARLSPAVLVAVGPLMAATCRALSPADGRRPGMTIIARDSEQAAGIVQHLVKPGDVLLVKGSRGIEMEKIIATLGPGLVTTPA